MIGPQYKRTRDEENFNHQKIAREEGNKEKLEKTISEVMKTKCQQQLMETLTDELPLTYIDCSEKGEKDILLRMMEVLYKKYKSSEIDKEIKKVLLQESMIEKEDIELLKKFANEYAGTNLGEDFLAEHEKYFAKRYLQLSEENPGALSMFMNFQTDAILSCMAKILEHSSESSYLYLDNVACLSIEEQQRINRLLFTRGAVGRFGDAYLRIKINNGMEHRKTRQTSSGQRVQSPHDYSDINIPEEDLEEISIISI